MSCTFKEKGQAFDVETSDISMTVENGCSSETSSEQNSNHEEENHVTLVCKQDINGTCSNSNTSDYESNHDKDNSTLNNGFNSKSDSEISNSEQNISQDSVSENIVEGISLTQNNIENQPSNLSHENGIKNSNDKLQNLEVTDTNIESQSQNFLPINEEIKSDTVVNNDTVRLEITKNTAIIEHVSNEVILQRDNVEILKEEQILSNNYTATVEIPKEETQLINNTASVENILNNAPTTAENSNDCLQSSKFEPPVLESDLNEEQVIFNISTVENSSQISTHHDTATTENKEETENVTDIGENLETMKESTDIHTNQHKISEPSVSVISISDSKQETSNIQVEESKIATVSDAEEKVILQEAKSNPFSISELLKTSVEVKTVIENHDLNPSSLLQDNKSNLSIEDTTKISSINQENLETVSSDTIPHVEESITHDVSESFNKKTEEVKTTVACDEKEIENHKTEKTASVTSENVENTPVESILVENTVTESQKEENYEVENETNNTEMKNQIENSVISHEVKYVEQKSPHKSSHNISDILSFNDQNTKQNVEEQNTKREIEVPIEEGNSVCDTAVVTSNQDILRESSKIEEKLVETCSLETKNICVEEKSEICKVTELYEKSSEIIDDKILFESTDIINISELKSQNENSENSETYSKSAEIVENAIETTSTDAYAEVNLELKTIQSSETSELSSKSAEIVESAIETTSTDASADGNLELKTIHSSETSELSSKSAEIVESAIETTSTDASADGNLELKTMHSSETSELSSKAAEIVESAIETTSTDACADVNLELKTIQSSETSELSLKSAETVGNTIETTPTDNSADVNLELKTIQSSETSELSSKSAETESAFETTPSKFCSETDTELKTIQNAETSELSSKSAEIVESAIEMTPTESCSEIDTELKTIQSSETSELSSKSADTVENATETTPTDDCADVNSELKNIQSSETTELSSKTADTVESTEKCATDLNSKLNDFSPQKETSLESPAKANDSFESRLSLNISGASSSQQASGSDSKKSTPEKRDICGLLNQTKPFHIPLDDKEVIEYLTQQRPRFGRPRKRKRDNTKAMQALQAMRDEGWKPGRRSHAVEDSDNDDDAETSEPPVKTAKRKYTKRKIEPVDTSPRKLRRVPARLANTSELRQANEAINEEENSLEPIAHQVVDPSTQVSDTSMENADPLALDTSTEAVELKENATEHVEDSLDTTAVKIVDPTQFLITEPVKKKIGRPRKDATKAPVIINTERVTRNVKNVTCVDKNITEKMIKNSIDLNSCDNIENIKRKYGKFKHFNKTSPIKKEKSSPIDLNKFSTFETSYKKKMGRPRKIISDVAEIVPKRKYIKKKFLNSSELSPMLKKKLGRPKKLEQNKILSKIIKRQGHFKCTKKALEQLKIKPCLVMLERKTGHPKKLGEDGVVKKKMGRPRKIVDENEVKEKKKMGRPKKLEGSPPTPKKPKKIKLESPDGEKIKKKQGRPRKILEDGSPREVKVSPKKYPEMKQIKQEIIESMETEEVPQETEMGGDAENSRDSDETKPCKILLDSTKVTKYLKTQKKRKREETHAEIIHKRFKAEMERLQNLGSENDLVPAPSPSKSTPKSNKSHISCEICGKTFVNDNQYRLNRHMAAVHNSEPFCKRCNTMFKDRTCFYSHVKKCKSMYANLQNTDISPIKPSVVEADEVILPPPGDLKQGLYCPYCYKTFCSKFSTERHMRIMHPDKVFCKFCLETFQDLQGYSEHLLICSERPKRDGKIQKLKNDIATKLNANMSSFTHHKPSSNIVSNKTSTTTVTQVEYESYSNEKDYGYSEFYSSSSNIDMEASSTSYSLEMSNSYSHDNSHWDHDNAKHNWDILPTQNHQQDSTVISSPQQNLAMLEFMPAVNESNQFDYIHHDTIQHTEDDKVYHML